MFNLLPLFAAAVKTSCAHGSFFGFPTWFEYLPGSTDVNNICTPQIDSISDIWLIAAAVLEILLRVGTLIAVGFIIYGGLTYITSQGEPDKTNKAKMTIMNALIGLIVAVMAAAIVAFIAKSVT